MLKILIIYFIVLFHSNLSLGNSTSKWRLQGIESIEKRINRQINTKKAKNIILIIGDGMGIGTTTAARIYEGQSNGEEGEENFLSFEKFPDTGIVKTYNTNQQTPDSAGTMTAIMTGVKTKAGVLSLGPEALRSNCLDSNKKILKTFLEKAEENNLKTGIVTTTRITHATPAAAFSHSSERGWENNSKLTEEANKNGCVDIAKQLVRFEYGDGIDVVFGGGRGQFLPNDSTDPTYPEKNGLRTDGLNLLDLWVKNKSNRKYIFNKTQLDQLELSENSQFLGLFNYSHLNYEIDRDKQIEPSLGEMTKKALDILKKSSKGFFLIVESGRIDHGHHSSNAIRALTETVELSRTVKIIQKNVDSKETLIIVTADHSHVFNLAGYPTKGNPILGKVISNDVNGIPKKTYSLDKLGKPYTTITYGNGPGYSGASDKQPEGAKKYPHRPNTYSGISNGRPDFTEVNTTVTSFLQESAIPLSSETHSAEDVAIYAKGPYSHLVSGVMEQNLIYYIMDKALFQAK